MTATRNHPALRRWFTIVTALLVIAAVAMILKPLRTSIAWAAILAFLMMPLQAYFTRRLRNRPSAAAGLITALTPVAIFAPLTLLGIAFAQQIAGIANSLRQNPQLFDMDAWLDPAQHPRIAGLFEWVSARSGLNLGEMHQLMRDNLQEWAGRLAAMSGQLFLNAAGVLLSFCLMLFILFFVLRDGSQWFARGLEMIPMARARRDALFSRLAKVTRAVVYGCGVTAAVQGALVGIGFALAGLPGPVVFGVMATIFALLPFGGAALVWVPATLYLFGSGQFGWGIFMLAWGGVVSISDNFIRPAIISRYTPVPTLLVFLGVIGGVSAFGMIGFIFGPVILVLATELLRFAEESMGRRD